MNILESIIYGIFSGFSEFLPISTLGHQYLLKIFFGASSPEPLRDLIIHAAILTSVYMSYGTYIEKLRREFRRNKMTKTQRSIKIDRKAFYDLSFIKSIAVVMLLGIIILRIIFHPSFSLAWIAFGFFVNGLLILIPEYMPHGNKDSEKMSGLDGVLLGIGSALSVFPGFSRVGICLSCAVSRGADQEKAYSWILILTIPCVLLLFIFDIVAIFQVDFGAVTFIIFLSYILSGIFAFAASVAAIYLMRFMLVRSGLSFFAFYSFGAALLSILLYLSA